MAFKTLSVRYGMRVRVEALINSTILTIKALKPQLASLFFIIILLWPADNWLKWKKEGEMS